MTNKKKLVQTLFCVAVMCVVGLTTPLFAVELTKEEDFSYELTDDMSGIRIKYIKTKDENSVTKVVIPEFKGVPVTSIGNAAFLQLEALETVKLPKSLKKIESQAFDGCVALKSIVIPDSVTIIEDSAFYECGFETLILPKYLEIIDEYTFTGCVALKSIVIPDSVTSIYEGAFAECVALESVTLPASLYSIGEGAFSSCLSLKTVIIPESLTKVNFDDTAFSDCPSMSVESQMALRKLGYKGSF